MKPCPDPSPAIFAMTMVLAIVVHFPVPRCQETRPYDICGESVQCGDFQIEYPFWGSGRPQHCGHPDFQLTCQSDVPLLRLGPVNYRVNNTDTSTHTITVARNDLWDTICPRYLYNTTYNSTLFNGINFDQVNLAMYYGCQDNNTARGMFPLAPDYGFNCTVNDTRSDSYFITSSLDPTNISSFLVQCNSSVTVPVERSWGDRLSTSTATDDDFRQALRNGFKLEWMANNNECDQCVRSGGRCGSNTTSPDVFACYCASGNFSATCNNVPDQSGGGGSKSSSSLGIVLASVGAVIVIVFVGCGIFVCLQRRKRTQKGPGAANDKKETFPGAANDKIEIFIRNHGCLARKRYEYLELKKMTNSFLQKLGQGGYGSVYKGQLPNGHQVAVKLLSEVTEDGEDFMNEVASISRTSHVNIVTLLGFCFEGNKRALLYEYMPNGSLDKFLRDDDSHLDWNTLFQIAKGIARGLEYLHRGCNQRIVHFDIKPHNILLDEEFVPKIADFGLAKLCKTKEITVSVLGARGTAGYMAPEVFFKSLGGASHKSDVYSYGMMVLEMTGAHKHNNTSGTSTSEAYFPDWVYKQVEVGGDLRCYGVTTKEDEEVARKMMMVSLWCIQTDPLDRPSISKVVEMLEGSFESLKVRPRHFVSSQPFQSISPSSMQSSSSERVSTMQGKISLPSSHEAS